MYNYTAFGLQIASEPRLPGLMPGTGNANVTIRFGEIQEKLQRPLKGEGVVYELNADSFLLTVAGVGRFLVNRGKEIIIEKTVGATDADIGLFTINTPIGALLYQRGYLPLHASAIATDGGCTLFTGVSGAGKSTILASFQQQGYPMLSDEICAISLSDTGEPFVHPGVPYIFLWRDILDYFGKDFSSLEYRQCNPGKLKVPVDEGFCTTPLPLKRIYVLNTKNSPGIEIEEIKGTDKFVPIKNNSYRHRIGTAISNPVDSFKLYASTGNHVIVKKVSRPHDINSIAKMRELIINDMNTK